MATPWRFEDGARLLACALLCSALPAGGGATPRERPLAEVSDGAPVYRAYGLGVVEVPAPPADLAASRPAAVETCPVEVRAIVRGDSRDTTFTVIAWGEYSTLLSAGEGVKTPRGWLAVSEIAADHVLLRRGDLAHRCPLKSAAARARRTATR